MIIRYFYDDKQWEHSVPLRDVEIQLNLAKKHGVTNLDADELIVGNIYYNVAQNVIEVSLDEANA